MMRVLALLLSLFSVAAWAECLEEVPPNAVCLSWTAPTLTVSGAPLAQGVTIDAYRVRATLGSEAKVMDVPGAVTTLTVPISDFGLSSVPDGAEIDFQIQAWDSRGLASGWTEPRSKAFSFPPTAPSEVIIK